MRTVMVVERDETNVPCFETTRPMRTYLAGGLRGDWQDAWIAAHPGESYFDPRTIQEHPMADIVWLEKQKLAWCDEVHAYLEADNPSGIGLAFECGYAVALGKPVTLVDEKGIAWLQEAVKPARGIDPMGLGESDE